MSGPARSSVLAGVLTVVAAACADHEFERPDRAARVAEAESLFIAARFDTIEWPSDSARLTTGNLVFAEECRRCHGPLGRGGTDYAEQQGLDVPSLVEPDWEFAGDPDAVRRRIFTGHSAGMPTWGIGRLTTRQIDAVAGYLLDQLRPDVLGEPVSPAER